MNRYIVKTADGTIRLYSPDIDYIQKQYPNATITLDEDKSYMEYIDNIINSSSFLPMYGECYRYINLIGQTIYIKLLTDGKGEYLDGIQYKVDNNLYVKPILWTLTSPQEFWEEWSTVILSNRTQERYTPKEFKKLTPKPKKLCKVYGRQWWYDDNGYVYVDTAIGSYKSRVERWKEFHDNPDALCVKIWWGNHHRAEVNWYHNEAEFRADFKEKFDNTPTYAQTPEYSILKFGFNSPHPDTVKSRTRLPFLKLGSSTTMAAIMTREMGGNTGFEHELEQVYKKLNEVLTKTE